MSSGATDEFKSETDLLLTDEVYVCRWHLTGFVPKHRIAGNGKHSNSSHCWFERRKKEQMNGLIPSECFLIWCKIVTEHWKRNQTNTESKDTFLMNGRSRTHKLYTEMIEKDWPHMCFAFVNGKHFNIHNEMRWRWTNLHHINKSPIIFWIYMTSYSVFVLPSLCVVSFWILFSFVYGIFALFQLTKHIKFSLYYDEKKSIFA